MCHSVVDDTAESPPVIFGSDIALSELASRGYECQQMYGDTISYGIPEKRWLHYVVGFLVVANEHFGFMEKSVMDTF